MGLWHNTCVMKGKTSTFRKVLAFAIVVFLVFISWNFFSTGTRQNAVGVARSLLTKDEMVIYGLHLIEKKDNNKTLEIKAEEAVISSNDSRTDLKSFTLLSEGGDSGSLTLVAGNGTLYNETNDITAGGGVIVRDENGQTLITDTLSWVGDEIKTGDDVRLFGDKFIIKGRGMLVKVHEERFTLLKNVVAIFNVN